MKIRLFKSFTKQSDSTKQPTGTYTEKDVVLKKETSINDPTFILSNYDDEFNYVYVPAWNRYYFREDVKLNINGLYELSCSCDFLATNKTEIGSTSAYILRSASASNGLISDAMYPATNNVTKQRNSINSFLPTDISGGTFILGIVGTESNTFKQGSVSYYGMTKSMLDTMCNVLFSTSVWQQIKNDFENPLDCIVSCYWVPVSLYSSTTVTIKFGKYELEDTEGYIIPTSYATYFFHMSDTFTLPKHPQALTRGNFLNNAPFTNYVITQSVIGSLQLPAYKLIDVDTLQVDGALDIITGQCLVRVVTTDSPEIEIVRTICQLGVPVALSQNTISAGALVGAGLSTLASIGTLKTGNIPGAISGGLGAIDSAINAVVGDSQHSGSNGSYLIIEEGFNLYSTFIGIADEDNTNMGRPLCEVRTINTLSGYILCKEASIQMARSGEDRRVCNNYLNSGFYYE